MATKCATFDDCLDIISNMYKYKIKLYIEDKTIDKV